MTESLTALLARIQAGDEDALLALHAQYVNAVYSVAYRVLNDQMAAEEVTQDTFMRLWHKSESFDPQKGAFLTWLLTITRRLAIDTFRKQQRDALLDPVFVDEDPRQWELLLAHDETSDLRRTLSAVIRDLPQEQRQVIELAYFHGMSHSQIAELLNEPLGTVKTRIRLGMQKLREAWLNDPVATNPKQDNSS